MKVKSTEDNGRGFGNMINEDEFYKQVNKRLEHTNLVQANNIIKNIVRNAPQNMYKLILDIINENVNIKPVSTLDYNSLNDKINELKERFEKINSGEMYFRAECNERYWEGDFWIYSDEDNIANTIENTYDLIVELLADRQYEYAKTLIDLILRTEYSSYSDDTGDGNVLSLEDLESEELITIDVEKLCLYAIYIAYQISEKDKRYEAIYEYFKLREFREICIKDAFDIAEETPKGIDEFWYELAHFLANKEGNIEYKLLKEATEQLDDNKYRNIVMRCINTHPQIALDYLNKLNQDKDYEHVISDGKLILNQMDNEYVVRSKIALLIATALNKTNRNDDIKEYLYQAFVSNTNVSNLLRIMFNNSFVEYEERIRQVINSKVKQEREPYTYPRKIELTRNYISDEDIKYFDFFMRRF